jgi:hypothetical protein
MALSFLCLYFCVYKMAATVGVLRLGGAHLQRFFFCGFIFDLILFLTHTNTNAHHVAVNTSSY